MKPTSGIRKQNAIRNHALLELALADKDLNSTAKCVLMVLLFKFQNGKTGLCNPSFEAIAAAVGLDRRSVVTAIKKLKDNGWITAKGTKGGAKQTNKFAFAYEKTGKQASHRNEQNREAGFPPHQNREEVVENREGDFPGTTEEPLSEAQGGSSNHRKSARARSAYASRPRPGSYQKPQTGKDLVDALYPEEAH